MQFFVKKNRLFKKKNIKKLSIIFLISYSIFLTKNISRMNFELNLSDNGHHNFMNFPLFWIDDKKYEEITIDNHKINLTQGSCWAVPSTCVRNISNLEIRKK